MRAKKGGKNEVLAAARLAHIRLGSKDMTSQEGVSAILIFKQAGDAAGCLAVLRDLEERGHKPSIYHYNPLLAAAGKNRNWRGALSLFKEMGQKGIKPDTITYSSTISACEKCGQWQTALELFEEMGQ